MSQVRTEHFQMVPMFFVQDDLDFCEAQLAQGLLVLEIKHDGAQRVARCVDLYRVDWSKFVRN